MKNNGVNLKVAEKISAVITLHKMENPGVPLSVSSLAKQAGVSRANLYVSHGEVIESLPRPKRAMPEEARKGSTEATVKRLKEELKGVKKTNCALLLLNGALRDRIRELEQRLRDRAPPPRKRTKGSI